MNVRRVPKMFALCLMLVLLPCEAFASLYVDHFAAPQGGPARAGSARETILRDSHFLLIDKTRKNDDPEAVDIPTYEFLSLFSDGLSSTATGSTRVTQYDSHGITTGDMQLPAMDVIVGRMHNAVDSRIIFTGKPTKADKALDGDPSEILQLDNLAASSADEYVFAGVPVPEPATLVLLTTGIIGLWLLKRRAKKAVI